MVREEQHDESDACKAGRMQVSFSCDDTVVETIGGRYSNFR